MQQIMCCSFLLFLFNKSNKKTYDEPKKKLYACTVYTSIQSHGCKSAAGTAFTPLGFAPMQPQERSGEVDTDVI